MTDEYLLQRYIGLNFGTIEFDWQENNNSSIIFEIKSLTGNTEIKLILNEH